MTDREILTLCEKYGRAALAARRKFEGLLPEVHRRQLYLQKNCASIYEFAAKLAGLSRDQVDIVLRLESRFQDKPVLKNALVEGRISVNKLVRVVSVATVENQQQLLHKAQILSSRALEVYVKDLKNEAQPATTTGQKSLHVQTLELAPDVEKELTEMQNRGIDINAMLREMLQTRKTALQKEKSRLAAEQKKQHDERSVISMPIPRKIPRKIVKILHAEYGEKCSYPGCNKPARHVHHEQPVAKFGWHDPQQLRPLCKEHHEIEHAEDKLFQKYRQRAVEEKVK